MRIDPELTPTLAGRLADLVLAGVERQWPFAPQHVHTGPTDTPVPSALHPIFCGCFDWHSAVHGHWTLARLLNAGLLGEDRATSARARLTGAITPDAVAVELAYFDDPRRHAFEWPYGWAWLMLLAAELLASPEPALRTAGATLRPLADALADRTGPRLERMIAPVRAGTHANSAFALGLMWDAAPALDRDDLRRAIRLHAMRWFDTDVAYPWAYEPSAYDFLSGGLTAAELMLRVLAPDAFASWLDRYWPGIAELTIAPISPAVCPDLSDGHLSHLVGLNLSRARGLGRLADGLPAGAGRSTLAVAALDHRRAGLADAFSGHYAGDHWLGTFVLHLLTMG
jgi:hypothetical protein